MGHPELANTIVNLLQSVGLPAEIDSAQGYDHGAIVPMYIMYPNAQVPLLQISILENYDPQEHFKIGRALARLREQNVLIVGSGLSYHNLRQMGPAAKTPSSAFDFWLNETLNSSPETRTQLLCQWERAPFARACHPEEDHLVPLFVALGAAENETATCIYHENDLMGGVTASSFRFG